MKILVNSRMSHYKIKRRIFHKTRKTFSHRPLSTTPTYALINLGCGASGSRACLPFVVHLSAEPVSSPRGKLFCRSTVRVVPPAGHISAVLCADISSAITIIIRNRVVASVVPCSNCPTHGLSHV